MTERGKSSPGEDKLFEEAERQAQEEALVEEHMRRYRTKIISDPTAVVLIGPTGEEVTVEYLEELGRGDYAAAFFRLLGTSGDPEADSWKEGGEIIH